MLAWLGLVTTAGAYLLFTGGLARLPGVTVSTLNLAEPLNSATLGLLVLGERLGARAAVGGLTLLTGLVLTEVVRLHGSGKQERHDVVTAIFGHFQHRARSRDHFDSRRVQVGQAREPQVEGMELAGVRDA
jgi:hypothetical protein